LRKITKGKYGVCKCCGSNINKQRLIAIPFVSLCVKCKDAEERDDEIMASSVYEGFEEEVNNIMDVGEGNIDQSEN
jgi:RNA polymerase-binding transcription factor DksA